MNANAEIILKIHENYILSLLGLDLGYTVEYSPSPLGVPSGFAFGNSLRRRAIFDVYPSSRLNTDTFSYLDKPQRRAVVHNDTIYFEVFRSFFWQNYANDEYNTFKKEVRGEINMVKHVEN